jgi:hypothetical protein
MLIVVVKCYAECRNTEHDNAGSRYAECLYAESRLAECPNAGCHLC